MVCSCSFVICTVKYTHLCIRHGIFCSFWKCKMCGKEENKENVDHISHVKIFLCYVIFMWEDLPPQNVSISQHFYLIWLAQSCPLFIYIIGSKGKCSIFFIFRNKSLSSSQKKVEIHMSSNVFGHNFNWLLV